MRKARFWHVQASSAALLSIPAARNHAEVRRQIEFIRSGKEKLRLAQAEELAPRQAQQTQLTAAARSAAAGGSASPEACGDQQTIGAAGCKCPGAGVVEEFGIYEIEKAGSVPGPYMQSYFG